MGSRSLADDRDEIPQSLRDGDENKTGQHRRPLQRTIQERSVGCTDDDESPSDGGDDPLNHDL